MPPGSPKPCFSHQRRNRLLCARNQSRAADGKKIKKQPLQLEGEKGTSKAGEWLRNLGGGRGWQHLASCLGPSCLPTGSCDKRPPTAREPQLSPEGSACAGWQPEARSCRGGSRAGNLIICAVGAERRERAALCSAPRSRLLGGCGAWRRLHGTLVHPLLPKLPGLCQGSQAQMVPLF